MGLLLDVAYGTAAVIAAPWLLFKLATDRRYRHKLGERFGDVPKRRGDAPCLWLHCASVGEVNLVKPLVKELKKRRPDLVLHVSTLTMAGRENAEKSFPGARVHYFPVDFSFAAARAIRRVRPSAIALVELEVWPNFTAAAHGVPMVIINGRLSHRSHRRYRRTGFLWRRVFRRIAKVGAQNETYAERFRDLAGPERVTATGTLKYDAALGFDPAAAEREFRGLLDLSEPLLIAGSTHDPEERIVLEAFTQLRRRHPTLRLLIAPRHLERVAEVEKTIAASFPCARRSTGTPPKDAVILLDTVGELAKVYTLASAVYIGGTFCARGGQNMLEPAALGKPVVSGPSLENFRDIADALVEAGGMRIVEKPEDLAGALDAAMADPSMGAKGRAAVEAGRGAIRATVDLIESVLP